MGDYIGDKKKKSGGSASGDTKPFKAVNSKNSSGTKTGQGKGSSSSSNAGHTQSFTAPKSGQSKSSAGSRSGQPKNSASGAKAGQTKSTGSKSSQSKNAGSKSGASKSSASGAKGSTAKKPTQQNGAKKSTSAGAKSGQSRSSSTAKSAYSQSGRSSSQKKSSSSGKSSYSDHMSKKRDSLDERELHASQRAADIKDARRRRTYNRNRKLFDFMFYAAIFIAVAAVIVIMSVTVLFGIEDIVVEAGDDVPYTSAQIVSGCDVRKGQNLFIAPIGDAGEQIMTNLPYIESCTVERRLPSTVIITVEGAKAVGVIIDETGQRVIVSSGMRVLENVVSAGDAPGVPVIEGVVVSATSVGSVVESDNIGYIETAVEIVRILDAQGLALDSISFTAGGSITAVYDGRINLIIGTASDLENKLLLAAMLINDGKITKHEAGDLNLSIEGKATFTPDYVKQHYSQEEAE